MLVITRDDGVPDVAMRTAWTAGRELGLVCRVHLVPMPMFMVFFYGANGETVEGIEGYTVKVNVHDEPQKIVEIVAHEMRHVYQMESGRLTILYHDGHFDCPHRFSWDGGPIGPAHHTYWQRPWERDAIIWSDGYCKRQAVPLRTLWDKLSEREAEERAIEKATESFWQGRIIVDDPFGDIPRDILDEARHD